MKIFEVTKNSFRRKKDYEEVKKFDLFLDYQAQVVYQYQPLKEILKANVQNLFFQESHEFLGEKQSYNGVLAYGEVQSGKTSNMLASTFFVYDQGFKYVFIFTGNIEKLHEQTLNRFSQEIKKFATFFQTTPLTKDSNSNLIYARKKKLNPLPAMQLHNLQAKNIDINYCENLQKSNDLQVFFVLKNYVNYDKVLMILKNSGQLSDRNSILLLDDESDWGFKNSLSLQTEDEPRLFQKLEEMKRIAQEKDYYLKYIGFTATPYKIIESNQEIINNFNNIILLESKKYQDWMSENEIITHDPFYCGINLFHNQNQRFNYQDQELNQILNKQFVTVLYHRQINETSLLYASLFLFLINSYSYKVDSNEFNSKKNIYGLFFPDINTDVHTETFEKLVAILPQAKTIVQNILQEVNAINSNKTTLKFAQQNQLADLIAERIFNLFDNSVLELKELLIKKIKNFSFTRLEELFSYILKWIDLSIEKPTRFIIKMSGKEEDTSFDQCKPIEGVNSVFIIGGYKISRGVTFDNLVFECIIKKSEKHDSTLQRARWFGYRKLSLLKNTDIILSNEVNQTFEQAAINDLSWREYISNKRFQVVKAKIK